MIVSVTLRVGTKILHVKALVDIGANGYAFANPQFARVISDRLEIEPIPLLKPKPLKAFNDQKVADVTHKILPGLEVAGHRESNASLFIADIGRHDVILGLPWMQQHGVVIDPGARQLRFKKGVCDHPGAAKEDVFIDMEPNARPQPLSPIDPPSSPESTVITPPTNILSRLSSRAFANKLPSIEPVTRPVKDKTKPKSQPKKEPKKQAPFPQVGLQDNVPLDISHIGAAPFLSTASKKESQTFSCSIKEIDQLLDWFQQNEDVGLSINEITPEASEEICEEELLRRIPKEYHDRLEAFRKKKITELPPHRDYDHKIDLEEGQKIGN